MKRCAFAVSVLALGFAAASPARADFAVVKFETGFCRIFWDSAANPPGTGWEKVAIKLPDWMAAWNAQTAAYKAGKCK